MDTEEQRRLERERDRHEWVLVIICAVALWLLISVTVAGLHWALT